MRSGALLIGVLATGCASTQGSVHPVGTSQAGDLSLFTKVSLETGTRGTLKLTGNDRERIVDSVIAKLNGRAPQRFGSVNPSPPDASTLHVTITFTRYDERNAFARAMLAGFGQLHIDADVLLEDRSHGVTLGKYEVTKTFAWGGMYGGFTRITDVEEGFAEAVVAALLREPQQ